MPIQGHKAESAGGRASCAHHSDDTDQQTLFHIRDSTPCFACHVILRECVCSGLSVNLLGLAQSRALSCQIVRSRLFTYAVHAVLSNVHQPIAECCLLLQCFCSMRHRAADLRSGDRIAFTTYRALNPVMLELLVHDSPRLGIPQPQITVVDTIFRPSENKRVAPKAALVSLAKPSSQRRQN